MDNIIEYSLNKIYHFYVEDFDKIVLKTLFSLLLLFVVLIIEWYWVGWERSAAKKITSLSKSTITDIFYYVITISGVLLLVSALMSGGIPYIIALKVKDQITVFSGISFLAPTIHFAIYFVILDFAGYWKHRALHEIPFLWQIHKLHHSASEFNIMTVFREHPLDRSISVMIRAFIMMILGVPLEEYPMFVMLIGIVGYVKHSNIPYDFGWFGKYAIQSPKDHWIHHSDEIEHQDKNYAINFAIWDHLFRTYYSGNKVNDNIGIRFNDMNKKGIFYDTFICYFRLFVDCYNYILCFVRRQKFESLERRINFSNIDLL